MVRTLLVLHDNLCNGRVLSLVALFPVGLRPLITALMPRAHPLCVVAAGHGLQILRRLLLFGFASDAKSLQPVPAVALCAPRTAWQQ